MGAIRDIIDLLRIRQEAKKADLETEKLSRELKDGERRIQVASFREVQEFDPKTRDVIDNARRARLETYHCGMALPPMGTRIVDALVAIVRNIWKRLLGG